jgi:hypothetical protein
MSSALLEPVRRAERGAVSWVTLLLLALAVTGGYLAWVWIPVYALNYEAKQVAYDYLNQAVKESDDALLVVLMARKLAALDKSDTLDENGERVSGPTVVVDPAHVTWERDTQADPPTLRIAFTYRRTILLPVLNRWVVKDLDVDINGDLARPNWGTTR